MHCPYCDFEFKVLFANGSEIPNIAPIVCEDCSAVTLLINSIPQKMTSSQLDAVKESPAWRDAIQPALDIIAKNKVKKEQERVASIFPADTTQQTLVDGSPVTPEHREINPETGMQKAYVVLSDEERAKGFVRPVRTKYIHTKCGVVTRMNEKIAETYAREPKFYGGTYCVSCQTHLPVGEQGDFIWDDGSGQKVGT